MDEARKVKRLPIEMKPEMYDRLREMAEARDRSAAAEVRRAIEDRLDSFESERDKVPA
jgi:predicted DNA-binding protein